MTGTMVPPHVRVVIVVVALVAVAGVAGINWYEFPTMLKPATAETDQMFGKMFIISDNISDKIMTR